jgi:hypothetical protein
MMNKIKISKNKQCWQSVTSYENKRNVCGERNVFVTKTKKCETGFDELMSFCMNLPEDYINFIQISLDKK